jgi:phytoene dehydrogenase-like protein
MKKVIIIGAGIAGMTCGIYLQRSGFETEIFELHTIPGGECTGWDRGEYHFDGCIHWLVGSKPGTSFNRIWRDTGALDDSVRIIRHEAFARYEEDGKAVIFYTDANRLEKHLLEIAPEDRKEIRKLCAALRVMGDFGMPMDKPMDMMTGKDGLKFAAKNLRGIMKMSGYMKLTMSGLADRFKNPLLRRAILAAIPGENTALALITTLAGMNIGDSGFPEGGSRALALRMEKKYLALGGKVNYRARVEKILVKDGSAAGIRLQDGSEYFADEIVSCADGYATLKGMLDDKYTPPMYENLFSKPEEFRTPTCALVFLGVDTKLPDFGRAIYMPRTEPIELGGESDPLVSLLNYGFDKTMAPEGKTVVACFYPGNYDFWKSAHGDKERYKAEKKRLEEDAIATLIRRFPEAEGHIEEADVVTPMTYERYCNAWRGSWMTWGVYSKDIPRYFPGMLEGLDHFLMAGMWTMPPGGLPGAAGAGRFAAQRLCMRYGVQFE